MIGQSTRTYTDCVKRICSIGNNGTVYYAYVDNDEAIFHRENLAKIIEAAGLQFMFGKDSIHIENNNTTLVFLSEDQYIAQVDEILPDNLFVDHELLAALSSEGSK